ncbi:3-oxoacyl-[acyl-carrier-protein] synthase III C-terminal domain-containing protein [Sphingomonas sp. HITSZ_GF]|uniref:hydroxymethylglutaryl-CoA synthase family protein n=1 Tax=Sphingomonas sp. HITSZ_GF TaxID=3037247 RepID=UPI00240E3E6D|nr:3-oxoacyl-[acyl-carrier-protein] synthase III C-terminal domain-containing protein [Sphingomonas sp. HITSZ_GF]MDG2533880.1 3-oxoacyl-[acyl-carrier-protein] synthase III C-terminal domain-containing protein [Sphingomonas sp. HITSZ_GF]
MSETGILAFGAYIPRRRLQRAAIHAANKWFAPGLGGLAKGERAVANWDEDAVTMAVEAARDCLTGIDRCAVQTLSLASTTLPFADRLNAGIVKEALTLADTTRAADAGGSLRAGTSALLAALEGRQTQLCIASDLRKARPASEAELTQGDGAAALLIGQGEVIATVVTTHSVTVDFVDHYRASGADFDYGWENRWIRDEGYTGLLGGAIRDALKQSGVVPETIDHAVIPISARGVAAGLAKKIGVRAEAVADTLQAGLGDTGTAHPLLMLAAVLEKAEPGQRILLAGFGQGADVLVLETTAALARLPRRRGVGGHLAARAEDHNYQRFLFHRGLLDLERGMRAELDQKQPGSTLYRHRKAVLGLVGGRCTKSGTVQFPRTDIGVNPNDRALGTQEDYPLADRPARIVTYTADSLSFSPDPPTYYGTIDFEGGGRLVAIFAEVGAEDVEVGRPMRMVFRINAHDEQRGFIKYFWKATPAVEGEQ